MEQRSTASATDRRALKKKNPGCSRGRGYVVSDRRKDTTSSPRRMGRLSDMADSDKLKALLNSMSLEEMRNARRTLDVAQALSQSPKDVAQILSQLPEDFWSNVIGLDDAPKGRGRPKGKQQSETLERIVDAAALIFLKYSQSKMIPLLYPKQHVPEAGRKAVNKLLSRNKGAIALAKRVMTREQAERIAKSLPRDKK
jgi:hypothetical protein